MSLIGSLEDLSLGDILQIISLSQKSGVLTLSGESGQGRIIFRDGLVCSAAAKGGPESLSGVLVDRGFVDQDAFQQASDEAREREVAVEEILVTRDVIARERIESLCREVIEQAVIEMFGWDRGDFSFDVSSDGDGGTPSFSLTVGINAQYLAMESARYGDESSRAGSPEPSSTTEAEEELSAHEMFGVSPDPDPDPELDSVSDSDLDASVGADSGSILAGEALRASDVVDEFDVEGEAVVDAIPVDEDADGSDASVSPVDALAAATLERVESTAEVPSAPIAAEVPSAPITAEAAESVDSAEHSGPAEIGVLSEPATAQNPASPEAGGETASFKMPLYMQRKRRDPDRAESVEADAPEQIPVSTPDESGTENELTEASLTAPPESLQADLDEPLGAESITLSHPVVLIDSDLPTLEWAKDALTGHFQRIHIFQRSELGLTRIRQYLVRGETPLVLMSPDMPGDRLCGIVDANDFVRRLKQQAARARVLWMCDEERGPLESLGEADGVVARPSETTRRLIREGRKTNDLAIQLATQLVSHLSAEGESGDPSAMGSPQFSPTALRRLKEATAVLSAGASRGEVLPFVIRFAAETFARVAMFMVREDLIVGMAQMGLGSMGGPDDAELQKVSVGRDECAWFRRVFESQTALTAGPGDQGDAKLAGYLGERIANQAYVAPILSAGQVVALLYADNLPQDTPVGDTSALEVVLHHAGLALDRAVLERALAEMEGADDAGNGGSGAVVEDASDTRAAGQSPSSTSRNSEGDR